MRTGLWMAIIILVVVMVGGVYCERVVSQAAVRYAAIGEQLTQLALQGSWEAMEQQTNEAWQQWRTMLPWLCAVVNHADAELVTAAMTEVRAATAVKDVSRAVSGCYAMTAAAQALREHERLSMENML